MWDSEEEEEEEEDDEFQTTRSVVYYQCKRCSKILVSTSKWDSHLSKCPLLLLSGGGGAITSIGFRLMTFKIPAVVIEGRCDDSNNKVGVGIGIQLKKKNKVMVQEEEAEGHDGGGESSMRAHSADGGGGNNTERAQRCCSSRKSAQNARDKLHLICSEMREEGGAQNKRSKKSRHVSSGDDDDDSFVDKERRRPAKKKNKTKQTKTMTTSGGKPKTCSSSTNRSTAGHTDLTFHLSCQRRVDSFECALCPGKCSTQKGLDSHVENIHKGPRSRMSCAVCGRVFNRRCFLNTHILAHEAAEEREAKFNLLQPWGPDLLDHLQKVRVNYDKHGVNSCFAVKQACKWCLLPQCSHPNFIAHIVEEHTATPEEAQFHCRFPNCCGEAEVTNFSTVRELVEHVRASHSKFHGRGLVVHSTTIKGSRDDDGTSSSGDDDEEQKLATTTKTKMATSTRKSETTKTSTYKRQTEVDTDLTFHPSCERRVNSFECPLCPGKFANKKWLDSHVDKVHGGTRSLTPCAVCGRVFNKTDSLNSHILAHETAEAREAKFNLLQPWGQALQDHLHKSRPKYNKNGVNNCWLVQQACKWCLLPQCSYPNFMAHIVEEHTATPEEHQFSCQFLGCGLKFDSIRELVEHVKVDHPRAQGTLTRYRLSQGEYKGNRVKCVKKVKDEHGKLLWRQRYFKANGWSRGAGSEPTTTEPPPKQPMKAKNAKRQRRKPRPVPVMGSMGGSKANRNRRSTTKPVKSFTPFQEPLVSSSDDDEDGEEEGDDGSDWERDFRRDSSSTKQLPKTSLMTPKYDDRNNNIPPEKRIKVERVLVDEEEEEHDDDRKETSLCRLEFKPDVGRRVKREVKTEEPAVEPATLLPLFQNKSTPQDGDQDGVEPEMFSQTPSQQQQDWRPSH